MPITAKRNQAEEEVVFAGYSALTGHDFYKVLGSAFRGGTF